MNSFGIQPATLLLVLASAFDPKLPLGTCSPAPTQSFKYQRGVDCCPSEKAGRNRKHQGQDKSVTRNAGPGRASWQSYEQAKE